MSKFLAALCAFAAVAMLLPATQSAQAQSRGYQRGDGTVIYYTDENGRRRARVIVQRRSYLDAGTEVLPGERKYHDYAFPPNYSASRDVLGPGRGFDERQPLNNAFDVPTRY